MTKLHAIVLGIATLALVVAGVAYHQFQKSDQSEQGDLQGQFYQNNPKTFDDQLSFVESDSSGVQSSAGFNVIGKRFATSSQISYWQNKTGSTVYVSVPAFGYQTGTASSTYKLYLLATTTSPTVFSTSLNYTALTPTVNGANSFLSSGVTYATSTAATTTNSVTESIAGRGNVMVAVPNNGYIIAFLEAVDAPACAGASACEAATSTKRGFNPFWRALVIR